MSNQWSCFYCDKGVVDTLPSNCPECGELLKKQFDEMSQNEKQEAVNKKHPPTWSYSLASLPQENDGESK